MRRQAKALSEIDRSRDEPIDPELRRALVNLVNPIRRYRGFPEFDT